ncbi:metal-dependent hydrolase [Gloeothece verrucosa]|uniref:Membrane-bound metal-dependent hydrolase n=1 Tax=Gloeothece verrucosa (strain PCC 7822) TaxID=497965 RepID=E0UJ08_GLOV7|nr:metal-dependent hydrolase [Gloeothece verrucosa]ADN14588.1 membrane-bound metal-dependent hydrolase [Gloeothece verrucosa PCC 7822]
MMSLTHAAIATAVVSFSFADFSPNILILAAIGSQLPDLDLSNSYVGQICFPVSHYLEDHFPHRSITHSLLATAATAIASIALAQGWLHLGWKVALALPVGHLFSCYADMFTKKGVQWFYPLPAWCVHGSNPNRRLRTGGLGEYWVLAGAIALLVSNYYLVQSGGLVQTASQQLGIKSSLLKMYDQNANRHHIWANIQGAKASDRSLINGRYLILAADGDEFIVTDGQGIYKTWEQIIPRRLTTSVGEIATTVVQKITMNHEPVTPIFQQIAAAHPNAVILLSGELEITFADEMVPTQGVDQFPTLTVSGKTATLTYHPLALALSDFEHQYASGSLSVKMITPIPEF